MSMSTSRIVASLLCSCGLSLTCLTYTACGGGDDGDSAADALAESGGDSASAANDVNDSGALAGSGAGSSATTGLEGCPVDSPTECTQPDLHWADVAPVFEAHCATAGCHDGASKLWPLKEYEHVADWSGEVRNRIAECTMPPAQTVALTPMPLADRALILQWIRCGFPE